MVKIIVNDLYPYSYAAGYCFGSSSSSSFFFPLYSSSGKPFHALIFSCCCFIGVKGTAYTLLLETEVNFAVDLVRNLESANQVVPSRLMDVALKASSIFPLTCVRVVEFSSHDTFGRIEFNISLVSKHGWSLRMVKISVFIL